MMRLLTNVVVVVVVVVVVHEQRAQAHESRPLYVEINEQGADLFSVQAKTPPSVPAPNAPKIVLPDHCTPAGPERRTDTVRERTYRCPGGLAGESVSVLYPVLNPSVSTLLRVAWLSGESHSILATPEAGTLEIPATESFGGVARQYLRLGIEHILEGYDHLLFLACLLLIAGTGRRIVITVTGFTIAHSITLALSALGLVRVPVAPVEAAIALSIVFLAVEIVRGKRDSLTYRYPIAVAAAFGLLHGFGFAAVLGETGLPQTEIPTALLFFNLGVEVGQLIFVFVAIAIFRIVQLAARKISHRDIAWPGWEQPAAYLAGTLAAFWMIDRIAGFWS